MINERMHGLGTAPNAIRALFAYGAARKAAIGADKVFDFSIGNPSVPTPEAVDDAALRILRDAAPEDMLHGYTQSSGLMEAKVAIARSLQQRFGGTVTADMVFMTVGAAASLSVSISAVTQPGDEVIVVTPYFPEYKVWIETAGASCVEVPAHEPDFQLDLAAIEAAITERTAAVIINSPNNPTGAVYPREALEELARMLAGAEERFGHPLYLISDEPYREIAYEKEVPWVPDIYARTLVCYSYSKSFSLPGERIGYVYVSNSAPDAADLAFAVAGAARALGYVCAPALWQRVIAECVDVEPDIEPYRTNRAALTDMMSRLGYEYVEPDGAFYLWVRALEPDEEAFGERAKAHELLLVPSVSFGSHGWVRIGYCCDLAVIENAELAFAALKAEYDAAE